MSAAIERRRPGWRERFLAGLDGEHALPEDAILDEQPGERLPVRGRSKKLIIGHGKRSASGARKTA